MIGNKDPHRQIKQTLHAELDKWTTDKVDDSYFYTMLEPFVRYKLVDYPEKRLTFTLLDKVREYEFHIIYRKSSRSYRFTTEVKELKFLLEAYGNKDFKNIRILITRITSLYRKEKCKNLKMFEKLNGEEVKLRISEEYKKTWGKYSENKFHGLLDVELLKTKKYISQKLVEYLKEEHKHVHFRPITAFFWQAEFFPEFFEKKGNSKLFKNLKILNMNFIIEIKFEQFFPKDGVKPMIRITQPRFYENDHISKGGLLSFASTPKAKKMLSLKNGIVGLLNYVKRVVFVKKLVVRMNESVSFYDDDIAIIDFKRVKLQNLRKFPTINNYREKMQAYPPIFHFQTEYEVAKLKEFEKSNRVILPQETANKIFKYNPDVRLPLFFEIISFEKRSIQDISKKGVVKRKVFCGVSEFTALNNRVILPNWMMQNLNITDGEMVNLRCIGLKSCNYVKLQPEDPAFFKSVRNYKSLLESQMKNFISLTIGDRIPVYMGKELFTLFVLDLKPDDAVSILPDKNGFLEMKLDVVPPINFDPSIHNPMNSTRIGDLLGGGGLGIKKLDDLEDEIKSPVKLEGVAYVKCENCGHSVKEFSIFLHEKHCKVTYFKCKDCEKVIKIADKEQHVQDYHTKSKCVACQEMVFSYKMGEHKQNECVERIVLCQYLGCPIPFKEKAEHEDNCASKTEKCAKCGKYVFIKHLELHMDSGCVYGETTADRKRWRPSSEYLQVQRERNDQMTPTLTGVVSDFDYHMNRAIAESLGMKGESPKEKKKESGGGGEEVNGEGESGPGERPDISDEQKKKVLEMRMEYERKLKDSSQRKRREEIEKAMFEQAIKESLRGQKMESDSLEDVDRDDELARALLSEMEEDSQRENQEKSPLDIESFLESEKEKSDDERKKKKNEERESDSRVTEVFGEDENKIGEVEDPEKKESGIFSKPFEFQEATGEGKLEFPAPEPPKPQSETTKETEGEKKEEPSGLSLYQELLKHHDEEKKKNYKEHLDFYQSRNQSSGIGSRLNRPVEPPKVIPMPKKKTLYEEMLEKQKEIEKELGSKSRSDEDLELQIAIAASLEGGEEEEEEEKKDDDDDEGTTIEIPLVTPTDPMDDIGIKCPCCNMSGMTEAKFVIHFLKTHQVVQNESLSCPICGKEAEKMYEHLTKDHVQ